MNSETKEITNNGVNSTCNNNPRRILRKRNLPSNFYKEDSCLRIKDDDLPDKTSTFNNGPKSMMLAHKFELGVDDF